MNENVIEAENPSPANPAEGTPEPLPIRVRKYLQQLAVRVMVYLLMYFLISVATIGPFFWTWFESTYVSGPRWVQRFYAPLLWLCDRISWLSWLVNKYVDWWIR
jgi:hypothetical protein